MNTQKVAITIPKNIVAIIDEVSKRQGLSRSRYISKVLHEKLSEQKARNLKNAYDRVFSDDQICREQLETVKWFEGNESKEGQEW